VSPRVDRTWPETAEQLVAGDAVKKVFVAANGSGEGMWVKVMKVYPWGIVGMLASPPVETYRPELVKGNVVAVNLHEVIDWLREHPNGG